MKPAKLFSPFILSILLLSVKTTITKTSTTARPRTTNTNPPSKASTAYLCLLPGGMSFACDCILTTDH